METMIRYKAMTPVMKFM